MLALACENKVGLGGRGFGEVGSGGGSDGGHHS